MSVFDDLKQLGGKLGILRIAAHATPSEPAKVATRSVTLAELRTELSASGVDAHASAALDGPDADFERVYAAAGVPAPEKGWGVARLIQALRAAGVERLARAPAQAAALELLAREGAAAEGVVKDALARDAALDAYAAASRTALAERAAEATRRRAEIAREVDRLKAEAAQLDRDEAERRARWKAWWQRKRAAEEAMAWAVGHLLEKPLVSVDDLPPELRDG